MPKPINHLSEALKHLDRAIKEIRIIDGMHMDAFDAGSEINTLWGAVEDAISEIQDCRNESSDLLDNLGETVS